MTVGRDVGWPVGLALCKIEILTELWTEQTPKLQAEHVPNLLMQNWFAGGVNVLSGLRKLVSLALLALANA